MFCFRQSHREPTKAVAQVVLSKELIDGLGDEGVRVLGRELIGAVAVRQRCRVPRLARRVELRAGSPSHRRR